MMSVEDDEIKQVQQTITDILEKKGVLGLLKVISIDDIIIQGSSS